MPGTMRQRRMNLVAALELFTLCLKYVSTYKYYKHKLLEFFKFFNKNLKPSRTHVPLGSVS